MASGRQKPHQLHENNDPYAEGWDARKQGVARAENPYTKDAHLWVDLTPKRREVRERDRSLWDLGWEACNEALIDDPAGIDDLPLEVDEDEDEDEDADEDEDGEEC